MWFSPQPCHKPQTAYPDSKAHFLANHTDPDTDDDADTDIDIGHNDEKDDEAANARQASPTAGPDPSSHIHRTQSLFSPPPQNSNPRRARPHAHQNQNQNQNPYLAHARPDAIPELYDIPLGMVNRVVYGPRRTPRPSSAAPPPRSPSH